MAKKRRPEELRNWALARAHIGEQLKKLYQARAAEELPPRLLALTKKLDESSTHQPPILRDVEN